MSISTQMHTLQTSKILSLILYQNIPNCSMPVQYIHYLYCTVLNVGAFQVCEYCLMREKLHLTWRDVIFRDKNVAVFYISFQFLLFSFFDQPKPCAFTHFFIPFKLMLFMISVNSRCLIYPSVFLWKIIGVQN